MFDRFSRFFTVLATVVALGACATGPRAIDGTGVVTSIHETQQPSTGGGVAGSIGGALVGGWLGSRLGGGTGRTISTSVGTVAGSAAGGIAGAQAGATMVWDVHVRFDDGIDRTIRMSTLPNVKPGARVRVSGGTITPM